MKLICVVKFVPDVDGFEYDHEKHVLIRESSRLKINPDDECAIGFALKMKKKHPDMFIEVLTMGPKSITPLLEDILRVGVDRGTIISDKLYAGSDTWVTSRILGRYLASADYDCILTGSHAADGDTSHVPPQIAELLGHSQLSCITRVDEDAFGTSSALVEVEDDKSLTSYELDMPAVLSFTRKSGYRLPFARYKNRDNDVSQKLICLSNEDLGFSKTEVGLKGSQTKVARAYTRKFESGPRLELLNDKNGIDTVFNFLKEKRFI
ncbi:electron transfer flavoprotein subunit beta/FixA family protein [Pseudovibrio sp. Tun.PSC04-5.I4]|uniref:electron transfer flavoprotein subunit beta/FixA family protein n=1 Tax=Pseudovibrio sp. Tun.PSC04-5.I4 TaxID=1798213 RepID=UPI00088CA6DC|nr:electron transfer flavoprotein subunit beta/FixA family protein [Pseudovibrio sp. Tun.PSC04-5.I4]SDQ15609.1 electron transfer flavoprotein beta subunit [Pseudovibrio sp. Tun.PSC04-5.I4]